MSEIRWMTNIMRLSALTNRSIYAFLLAFCLIVLVASLILQFDFHLQPCPLCIIDRVIVFFLTITFALAFGHNPKNGQIYFIIGILFAFFGIIVAARHLWLIHLPSHLIPDCGPGLNYLFETFPLHEAIMLVLKGSGECGMNKNYLLGISLPGWAMLAFAIVLLGCLLPLWKKGKN